MQPRGLAGPRFAHRAAATAPAAIRAARPARLVVRPKASVEADDAIKEQSRKFSRTVSVERGCMGAGLGVDANITNSAGLAVGGRWRSPHSQPAEHKQLVRTLKRPLWQSWKISCFVCVQAACVWRTPA